MNASLPRAFGASGWGFAIPLVSILVGRVVWMVVRTPNKFYREHYERTLVWAGATTPLWLIGAAVAPDVRLRWWGIAIVIEIAGVWTAHLGYPLFSY